MTEPGRERADVATVPLSVQFARTLAFARCADDLIAGSLYHEFGFAPMEAYSLIGDISVGGMTIDEYDAAVGEIRRWRAVQDRLAARFRDAAPPLLVSPITQAAAAARAAAEPGGIGAVLRGFTVLLVESGRVPVAIPTRGPRACQLTGDDLAAWLTRLDPITSDRVVDDGRV